VDGCVVVCVGEKECYNKSLSVITIMRWCLLNILMMNGWMDEWMNGWMDEWMNGCVVVVCIEEKMSRIL